MENYMSERKFVPALLLLLFLGGFGAHRFYVGKIGTGILFMFTLGGMGIWALVDLITLITGSFTDIDGKTLQR
jgi:TM2 domain-containing membrane protein YozV